MWYQCNTVVKEFLSTLSLRRATTRSKRIIFNKIFLSTLSLRRATRNIANSERQKDISIHALLAESDVAPVLAVGRA